MKMKGTQAITNYESWYANRYNGRYGNLLSKVVILYGENSETVRTLIVSFAKRGADVAVVCSRTSQASIGRLHQQVDEMGRRLYLVDEGKQDMVDFDRSVPMVLNEFGRVDVLIDLSAKTKYG
jgi:NAD(P)-dependent dehydrogenase (short-subunit alcohol dehydrogenase family)